MNEFIAISITFNLARTWAAAFGGSSLKSDGVVRVKAVLPTAFIWKIYRIVTTYRQFLTASLGEGYWDYLLTAEQMFETDSSREDFVVVAVSMVVVAENN